MGKLQSIQRIIGAQSSWWSESASQVTLEHVQKQIFAAPISSSFSFLLHEQRK